MRAHTHAGQLLLCGHAMPAVRSDARAAVGPSLQMVPASSASASKRAGGLPNPFAPLVRLASSLADGQELSRKVQSHATTLEQRGNSANAQQQQEASQGISASASQPPAAAESPASAPSGAGEPRQYCLQDVPARRLLAGGSPPQLAWVPLRVALALLHALPQHFLLMQGVAPAEGQPKGKQRRHKGQGSEGGSEGSGGSGASAARSTFNAWSSPSALEVCVIPVRGGGGGGGRGRAAKNGERAVVGNEGAGE